jgi:DNA polymerase-3 subunit gamma/tau
VSLALYRRYRPETFAEVIGQDQVTGPLQQAIRNDRVHHAYLFSGPRGCGKTTSARLLARCLNCEKGPTPEPCGKCQSCRDLARGGGGSVDVVEIDAASHGGVDDARDLRERAFFTPAVSRYKIYIVDEAHMVTPAGFNALLKVVEEPPPHLKFIFATTEPDKVIPTIRSRTHHYPFRLVPPSVMRDYLAMICEREGVTVEPAVLPLVVRAGAGSVRDALSVLDQLIAGAGESGVTYALATALLGFTDAQLLDDVVDAFAAGDGASVFTIVERVIEGGHDPRRFAQDLLERLRDLVILSAVPDAESSGLIEAPADQLERMRQQAENLGSAELTRAADIVNAGLTEMRGATAPRLQLELICARIMLPGADDDERGLHARVDRLERRMSIGALQPTADQEGRGSVDTDNAAVSPGAKAPPADAQPVPERRPADTAVDAPAGGDRPAASESVQSGEPHAAESATRVSAGRTRRKTAGKEAPPEAPAAEGGGLSAAETAPPAVPGAASASGGFDLAGVRRMWPDILEVVKAKRRFTWLVLLDHVQVVGLSEGALTLAFANEGQRKNFTTGGSEEVLREAIHEVLGADWRIDAVLDPGHAGGPGGGSRGSAGSATRPASSSATANPRDQARQAAERTTGHPSGTDEPSGEALLGSESDPAMVAVAARAAASTAGEATIARAGKAEAAGTSEGLAATARVEAQAVPQQRADEGSGGDSPPAASGGVDRTTRARPVGSLADDPDAHAHPGDQDLDDGGLAGAELLAKELGATLIGEIDGQQG